MKKIIPIATVASFLIVMICALTIQLTTIPFSLVFNAMLLSLSAFLGLFCFWKTNYIKVVAVLGAISFVGLAIMLLKYEQLSSLWNVVLSLHLVLIGTTLFIDTKSSKQVLLAKITRLSIFLAFGSFIVLIFGNVETEWLFQLTLALLTLMALLLIANKFGVLFKK